VFRPAYLTIVVLASIWGTPFLNHPLQAAERPNVILLFIDDLGWSDVGCYGNRFVETPHIDRLAKDGMRFTDFYAAGAVCSPTRCAVQSGQNQARIGITAHIPGHWRPFERVITPMTTMALPLEVNTVGESLRAAGYATGYIGKWHLGNNVRHAPQHQGYDFAAVINGPHLPGRYRVAGRTDLKPKPQQYRTEFEGDLSAEFIRKHRNDPFFLMVSPYAVHIPLAGMSGKVDKYRRKATAATDHTLPHPVYAAMIEHVDDLVGRIVATVQEVGLTDRTMILFTSDNGGLARRYDYQAGVDPVVTTNHPLRDEKGSLYEGGVRVPLIVKYPPHVKAGSVAAEPAISYDFFPTFVDFAGGQLPENQAVDGLSLRPVLEDASAKLNRQAIHFHYPHYHHSRPASAIRKGDWKLIEFLDGSPPELYNLAKDIGEQTNLAKERPGLTTALRRELSDWRLEVGARMPLANPHFDEDRAGEWWSRRSGKSLAESSKKRRAFPRTEKEAAK
jgi:uncharacterized sulfatase